MTQEQRQIRAAIADNYTDEDLAERLIAAASDNRALAMALVRTIEAETDAHGELTRGQLSADAITAAEENLLEA
jgi:hypothetical protein